MNAAQIPALVDQAVQKAITPLHQRVEELSMQLNYMQLLVTRDILENHSSSLSATQYTRLKRKVDDFSNAIHSRNNQRRHRVKNQLVATLNARRGNNNKTDSCCGQWQRWVLRAVKLWNLAVTAEQSSLLWQAMTASVALAVAPGHRIPARQPWVQQLAVALAAMGVQLDLHQPQPVCQAAVQSACSAWQLKQPQDAVCPPPSPSPPTD